MSETLFVISSSEGLSEPMGLVLLGVGLAIFAIFAPKEIGERSTVLASTGLRKSERVALLITGIGFSVLGAFQANDSAKRQDRLYRAYAEGKCRVVEGTVHLDHVQPWEGHDLGDVVRLGDEEFVIDHFRSTPAYHQTIAYGGVLREGAAVRVWLYRGAVLRIDRVPQTSPPGSEQNHDVSP
ncbi:MAG: hypothetical protein H6718_13695 [Polyangiaceae bacterium]|nr:hypothetical protein [Polyangiaceae bacterium]MCB9605955.1 hypothetical protein [Polyangiaceae bacterium]